MKKEYYLSSIRCTTTATSCSDFLDVQPGRRDARDNAYFLNDQQAIDAVDGLYERFIGKPCMVENYFGSRVLVRYSLGKT